MIDQNGGYGNNVSIKSLIPENYGKSAIASAGDFELMFTNTEVHNIVRVLKTDQDNPNLY